MNSSKKALQAEFKGAAFDPREPSSLTTIVSCNDPRYLVQRVDEFLRDSGHFSGNEWRTRIRDAVAVLGYALTLVPAQPKVEPKIDKPNESAIDPAGLGY